MFKKVCIIGCGLIGSSIARGIKKNKHQFEKTMLVQIKKVMQKGKVKRELFTKQL